MGCIHKGNKNLCSYGTHIVAEQKMILIDCTMGDIKDYRTVLAPWFKFVNVYQKVETL